MKTLAFNTKESGELFAFAATVAALQYHSVKFGVERNGDILSIYFP